MDMFDCVIPTRYARSATLFTRRGRIRMNHRRYRRDLYPIDTSCDCYACKTFTRAYLHHLYAANEILAAILGATHNVRFYQRLMAEMREAILARRFLDWKREFYADYGEPSADAREKVGDEGA
jgi:queuine tRNA-ribosyltransferase